MEPIKISLNIDSLWDSIEEQVGAKAFAGAFWRAFDSWVDRGLAEFLGRRFKDE